MWFFFFFFFYYQPNPTQPHPLTQHNPTQLSRRPPQSISSSGVPVPHYVPGTGRLAGLAFPSTLALPEPHTAAKGGILRVRVKVPGTHWSGDIRIGAGASAEGHIALEVAGAPPGASEPRPNVGSRRVLVLGFRLRAGVLSVDSIGGPGGADGRVPGGVAVRLRMGRTRLAVGGGVGAELGGAELRVAVNGCVVWGMRLFSLVLFLSCLELFLFFSQFPPFLTPSRHTRPFHPPAYMHSGARRRTHAIHARVSALTVTDAQQHAASRPPPLATGGDLIAEVGLVASADGRALGLQPAPLRAVTRLEIRPPTVALAVDRAFVARARAAAAIVAATAAHVAAAARRSASGGGAAAAAGAATRSVVRPGWLDT
jgi:hypothetical protein